ncbi:MAG TPA: type II toxin-antitoxin system death-on-curing family toxin [bacterium]|jgi:death-on-curing protein|nr:type II toxin-antitoxin system death-on-curing family toxin [bacterium]
MDPVFLSLEKILEIHQIQIREFGGSHGVRDIGLLQSATAMPQAQFGAQYLHGDLFEMAAAYLYHVALNHPFVDGNKRVAAMAADIFLLMNGILLTANESELTEITLEVAQRKVEKPEIASFFRKHSKKMK